MSEQAPEIAIVGATGMLGRAWRELLDVRGVPFVALTRSPRPEDVGFCPLDLTDADAIDAALQRGLRAVINCAAFTAVDDCETRYEQALAVNGTAVGHLARRCEQINATLVHYSTDYVFNGRAEHPYPIDAPHDPINAYGRSKAAGERALLEAGGDHQMIRTSWVYAPWGSNFVRTMARLTGEKEQLRVVDDQRGRPTSAQHLARTSLTLLERAAPGIYHATDGGQCSWFEFADEINRQFGHACDVQPCGSETFPRPASRPAYSVLDISSTEIHTGPMPHWKQNLADVLAHLQT